MLKPEAMLKGGVKTGEKRGDTKNAGKKMGRT